MQINIDGEGSSNSSQSPLSRSGASSASQTEQKIRKNQLQMNRVYRQFQQDLERNRKKITNLNLREFDQLYIHFCRLKKGDEFYAEIISQLLRERDNISFIVPNTSRSQMAQPENRQVSELRQQIERIKKELADNISQRNANQKKFVEEKGERMRLDQENQRLTISEGQIRKEKTDLQTRLEKEKTDLQTRLEKEKSDVQAQLNRIKSGFVQERGNFEGKLKAANDEIDKLKRQADSGRTNEAKFQSDIANLKKEKKDLEIKGQTYKSDLMKAQDDLKKIQAEKNESDSSLGKIRVDLAKIQKEKQNLQSDLQKNKTNLTNLQAEKNKSDSILQTVQEDLTKIRREKTEIESNLQKTKIELTNLQTEKKKSDSNLQKAQGDLTKILKEKQNLEYILQKTMTDLTNLQAEKNKSDSNLQTVQGDLTKIRREKMEIESNLQKMKTELTNLQTAKKNSDSSLQKAQENLQILQNNFNIMEKDKRTNEQQLKISKNQVVQLKDKMLFNGSFFQNHSFSSLSKLKPDLLDTFKKETRREIEMTFVLYSETSEPKHELHFPEISEETPYFLFLLTKKKRIIAIASLNKRLLLVVDGRIMSTEQDRSSDLLIEFEQVYMKLSLGGQKLLRLKKYCLNMCWIGPKLRRDLQETEEQIEIEHYEIHQLILKDK